MVTFIFNVFSLTEVTHLTISNNGQSPVPTPQSSPRCTCPLRANHSEQLMRDCVVATDLENLHVPLARPREFLANGQFVLLTPVLSTVIPRCDWPLSRPYLPHAEALQKFQ